MSHRCHSPCHPIASIATGLVSSQNLIDNQLKLTVWNDTMVSVVSVARGFKAR